MQTELHKLELRNAENCKASICVYKPKHLEIIQEKASKEYKAPQKNYRRSVEEAGCSGHFCCAARG